MMAYSTGQQAIFENRQDAGRQLAAKLYEYRDQSAVVLAIPNGGVPVALEVASAIDADLDLIICRKMPLLVTPEGNLGAIADDGTIILNEEAAKRMDLSQQQIAHEASKIRAEIKQQSILYKANRLLVRINDRTVIIVDDGLASGFTMMAAVESVRHRRAKEVVIAVPVASATAVRKLKQVAVKVVTCTTDFRPKFYVSDFYRDWHDLSDDEVIQYLRQWRMRRFR